MKQSNKQSTNNTETFVFISDIHIPYEDKKSLRLTLDFIYNLKPTTLILGGDIIDCADISFFDKNPERINTFQRELDECKKYLTEIRKNLPNTKIFYIDGNHEGLRLERWLMRNIALASLDVLTIPKLLELDKFGIEYVKNIIHKNFLFKHGEFCGQYPATKELNHERLNGISGHVHRITTAYQTSRLHTLSWHTNGHLSDTKQVLYGTQIKNWQQGFTVITFKDNDFYVEPIYINESNYSFIYGGKVWKS